MEIISSKNNNTIKYISGLNKSAKARKKEGCFSCEGLRICYDAFLSGAEIEIVVFTKEMFGKNEDKITEISRRAKKSFMIDDKLFPLISDTKSPQGIICVVKTLDKYPSFDKIIQNGRVLTLEDIQDPNNLGTILRTAEAFNIDCVLLTKGCCDVYSPKVVRGSMGALFRQNFCIIDGFADFLTEFNKLGTSYAAILDDKAQSLKNISFDKNSLVVIGNEGNGIKESTARLCTDSVYIPMDGKAQSLNASVAASILMWEMVK